jgi:hypothetical protein
VLPSEGKQWTVDMKKVKGGEIGVAWKDLVIIMLLSYVINYDSLFQKPTSFIPSKSIKKSGGSISILNLRACDNSKPQLSLTVQLFNKAILKAHLMYQDRTTTSMLLTLPKNRLQPGKKRRSNKKSSTLSQLKRTGENRPSSHP